MSLGTGTLIKLQMHFKVPIRFQNIKLKPLTEIWETKTLRILLSSECLHNVVVYTYIAKKKIRENFTNFSILRHMAQ